MPSGERGRINFDDAEAMLAYLRGEAGADYLHFLGDGNFGQAWVAWEDERLYFTSESGLRIEDHSALLFAQQCLEADAYGIQPVSRSDVAFLDEIVSE